MSLFASTFAREVGTMQKQQLIRTFEKQCRNSDDSSHCYGAIIVQTKTIGIDSQAISVLYHEYSQQFFAALYKENRDTLSVSSLILINTDGNDPPWSYAFDIDSLPIHISAHELAIKVVYANSYTSSSRSDNTSQTILYQIVDSQLQEIFQVITDAVSSSPDSDKTNSTMKHLSFTSAKGNAYYSLLLKDGHGRVVERYDWNGEKYTLVHRKP